MWQARNHCLSSRKGLTSQSNKVLNQIFNLKYIKYLSALKGQFVENLIKWKRLWLLMCTNTSAENILSPSVLQCKG